MYVSFEDPETKTNKVSLKERLASLDPFGTILVIGSMACLVLALQWGGSSLLWRDSKVWGCLLGFGLLMAAFLVIQVRQKERSVTMRAQLHFYAVRVLMLIKDTTLRALIPIRILTHRTVGFGCMSSLFTIMAFNVLGYYLPFYFQASRGLSARTSGLYILALACPETLAGLSSGLGVTLTKQIVPFLVFSGAVLTIGSGLLSTLNVSSSIGSVLGYEVIASVGFGLGIQVPLTAIRNVLDEVDIPIGNSLVIFCQSLGTVFALPIAQAIFISTLRQRLAARLDENEIARIIKLGASNVNVAHMDEDMVSFVAEAYADGVDMAIYFAIAAAGMVFFAACMMEWKRLEKKEQISNEEQGSSERKTS